ncbi:hypothetical protein GMD78_06105 [Ornithinibacillus sp. L9]|uniref:Uncharacterized protein n=1 Tax=Ornithinibacillus caprae TaxID=2678566 RepID=A0A6N8FEK1_9BACI|nr:hypothetical protein [Ornithinibacillus caprae]MUK87970.1 hypothetical protein [Ornithinibacillus caprae]
MKNKKLLLSIITLGFLAILAIFGTLKQSSIYDFPVPIIAKVDEEYSDDSLSYRFNGINRVYVQHVKLFGWKEVERLGSQGIFEKDGKRIALTTYKDGFDISAVNE